MEDGQHPNLGVDGVTGRTVLAGQEVELGVPVRVGYVSTLRERLLSIDEKQGRSGPLVVVATEESYTNQRRESIARTVTTRIFR